MIPAGMIRWQPVGSEQRRSPLERFSATGPANRARPRGLARGRAHQLAALGWDDSEVSRLPPAERRTKCEDHLRNLNTTLANFGTDGTTGPARGPSRMNEYYLLTVPPARPGDPAG